MEYEVIEFPEIQKYMDLEGFDDNATLINPNAGMSIGNSTYLVDVEWLKSLDE